MLKCLTFILIIVPIASGLLYVRGRAHARIGATADAHVRKTLYVANVSEDKTS